MAQPVKAGGFTPRVYADLTRASPTTTYAADEHVAQDASTAANVFPLRFPACREANGSGVITGGTLVKSTNTIATAGFRLWLFTRQPFAVGGYPLDNAALVTQFTYTTALKHFIGTIDFATADFIAHSSSASCQGVPLRGNLPFSLQAAGRGGDSTEDYGDFEVFGRIPGNRLIYGVLSTLLAYVPGASETFRISLDVQAD